VAILKNKKQRTLGVKKYKKVQAWWNVHLPILAKVQQCKVQNFISNLNFVNIKKYVILQSQAFFFEKSILKHFVLALKFKTFFFGL
jgi:hypothetical protein